MRLATLALAAVAVACGGSTDTTTPVTSATPYTLSLATPALALTEGQSGTVRISLNRSTATLPIDTVTLSARALPTGATATFAPNPAADFSVVTIKSGTAAPGTYNVVIAGAATGLAERTTTLSLKINALTPASRADTASAR